MLSGKTWPGFRSGKEVIRLGAAYAKLADTEEILYRGGHLFSGRAGRAGRLLEVFHLKLNLVLQALEETRAGIRHQQMPFLVLGAESFRLQLFEIGTGLPLFWSAQVDLAESNCALAISAGESDLRYFIPPELPGSSIYRPADPQPVGEGIGDAADPESISSNAGRNKFEEATLATDEEMKMSCQRFDPCAAADCRSSSGFIWPGG